MRRKLPNTKTMLRGVKIRMDQTILDVFKMDDHKIEILLHAKGGFSVAGQREDNIKHLLLAFLHSDIIPEDILK